MDNFSEKLTNLIKLHKEGQISTEEFNQLKKNILNDQLSGRATDTNNFFESSTKTTESELPTFITDIQYCFKNVADLNGRCPKRPYTNFFAIYIIYELFSAFFYQKETLTALDTLYSLGNLVMVIVFCSVAIKRLHDANLSGWWCLVYIALQILMVSEAVSGKENSDLSNISALLSLIFIGVLYFIKGTIGTNSYGEQINKI